MEKHHLLVLRRWFHSGKCYLGSRLLQKLLSGEGGPWDRCGSSLRECTSPTSCLLALPKESPERAPAAVSTQLPAVLAALHHVGGRRACPSHALETQMKGLRGAWGRGKRGPAAATETVLDSEMLLPLYASFLVAREAARSAQARGAGVIKGHFWPNRHHSQGANDS